ncbi:MAG: DUF2809 domain-containing protein [Flavobacterium haoranii]
MFRRNKDRIYYFGKTLLIIALGILSRKIEGIPLFVGDILYAVMTYFGLKALFLASPKWTLLFSLLFCFTIEISQTIHWESLTTIRRTTLGHYVLGEGFLWSDLVCYTIGISCAYFIDTKF